MIRIQVARLPISAHARGLREGSVPKTLVEAREAIVSAQHQVIVFL